MERARWYSKSVETKGVIIVRLKDVTKSVRKPEKQWYQKPWCWVVIILVTPPIVAWCFTPYGFWSFLGAFVLGSLYDRRR